MERLAQVTATSKRSRLKVAAERLIELGVKLEDLGTIAHRGLMDWYGYKENPQPLSAEQLVNYVQNPEPLRKYGNPKKGKGGDDKSKGISDRDAEHIIE
jgi:hypothetical protein